MIAAHHWLITQLLRTLGAVSQIASPEARRKIGAAVGRSLSALSARRRAITLGNLTSAFPEKPETWLKRICRQSYANLGITLAELLAFPSMSSEEIRNQIEYHNLHLIEDGYRDKKGVILLSAHYGNWELLAYALPLFTDVPVTVIVKPQRNAYADDLLNTYRSLTGNRLIPMHKAARDIRRIFASGEALALLADQSAQAAKDVFVPFFGRDALTYKAPAALALKYDAPIIMGFAHRNQAGKYIVTLREIPHHDLEYTREGVAELTRRHTQELENDIRRQPELWVWQHRRWKHQPESSSR